MHRNIFTLEMAVRRLLVSFTFPAKNQHVAAVADALDFLAREGETDEPWPPPAARSVAQVAQRTIVVACAHAEAIAVPVESDDRHQDRVETE